MAETRTLEEKILDARDNLNTALHNLKIDNILLSVYGCLLQNSLPFSVSKIDKYAFFSQINNSLEAHLREIDAAWNELERLQQGC